MRVLLQRVSSACVTADGETLGEIGAGLVLLVGFGRNDDASVAAPMAARVCGLRVFEDDDGRFQYSANDVGGELLAVPQFTLYGDTRRGRRPDFTAALAPARFSTGLWRPLTRRLAAGWPAAGSAPAWRCSLSMTDR